MLRLKCNVCLDVLKTQECGPIAAPCGHIYCQTCLDSMSRTRETTNCAFCRQTFSIAAVVKLFVEYEETRPAPSPPLTVSQKEAGQSFIETCTRVKDNAEKEETLQIIVSAEKLFMDIQETHKDTEAEDLLKLLNVTLGEFRKRLKLFSRMNALQQKNADLERERDSLRRVVAGQLKEADEATQAKLKIERHLKQVSAELEAHHSRERCEQASNDRVVHKLKEELQAERTTSTKFKKKYFVTLQKLEEVKHHKRDTGNRTTGPLGSETEISDDSFEIISPTNSQTHSDAEMKASLRRQISSLSSTASTSEFAGKRKTTTEERTQKPGRTHKRVRPSTSSGLDIVQESPQEKQY